MKARAGVPPRQRCEHRVRGGKAAQPWRGIREPVCGQRTSAGKEPQGNPLGVNTRQRSRAVDGRDDVVSRPDRRPAPAMESTCLAGKAMLLSYQASTSEYGNEVSR
jgi:hypothetical protein